MNKTLNFKTLKTLLQLSLMDVSIFGFSQTNPDLEMASGASNPTGNGPVLTTSINFQKNTNNPSWSSFAFVLFLNLYLLVVLYFKYFSLILWFERCAP